jgi:hypothetical protein
VAASTLTSTGIGLSLGTSYREVRQPGPVDQTRRALPESKSSAIDSQTALTRAFEKIEKSEGQI